MEYINRREAGAVNNDRPFYGKQKVQTIRRYAEKFMKILRYIWRTESIENRPRYRLTMQQREALCQFRQYAAKAVVARRPVSSDASLTPAPGQERYSSTFNVHHFVDAALAFWIAMFDHELGDSEFESGIISGLAVLGADSEDGGWMPTITYTPTLAAIITTMRAVMVRRAWRQRRRYIAIHSAMGMSQE